jgi:hypothetical protein
MTENKPQAGVHEPTGAKMGPHEGCDPLTTSSQETASSTATLMPATLALEATLVGA